MYKKYNSLVVYETDEYCKKYFVNHKPAISNSISWMPIYFLIWCLIIKHELNRRASKNWLKHYFADKFQPKYKPKIFRIKYNTLIVEMFHFNQNISTNLSRKKLFYPQTSSAKQICMHNYIYIVLFKHMPVIRKLFSRIVRARHQ